MWVNAFSGMDDEEFERVMRRVGDGLAFVKAAAAGEIVLTDKQRECLMDVCASAGWDALGSGTG